MKTVKQNKLRLKNKKPHVIGGKKVKLEVNNTIELITKYRL